MQAACITRGTASTIDANCFYGRVVWRAEAAGVSVCLPANKLVGEGLGWDGSLSCGPSSTTDYCDSDGLPLP